MKSYEKKVIKFPLALLRFFLYALCGALTALPLVIPELWLVGWIAPFPVLFYELFSHREKDSYIFSYGRGMSFFWFFGVVVFFWFVQLYPLDFLGFDKTSAILTVILATCGIPLLQSTVSSLMFICICFVRKRGATERHPFLCSLFCALLFSLFEYFHTLTWAGVPWGRLAVGQTGFLPVVQSASLFGSYFITFIMILFASLLALSLKKCTSHERRKAVLFALIAISIFFANLIFGAIRMNVTESALEKSEKVTCGAVQGNIRFEDKWGDKEWYTMELYKDLTNKASNDGASLIIWPETAIPYDYNFNPRMYRYFNSLGQETDGEILVTFFESANGNLYNCARLLSNDGELSSPTYKKRHLVPFGEYTPLEDLISTVFPPLAEISAIDDPISPGNSTAVIDTSFGKVGTLICFDSIYEELCLESVRDGAELIAISTNDSWFSGSAALRQHNAQAQLRAIENCRYVVRAANTGISSVISPTGRIISSLGDSLEGYILGDVSFIEANTLYTLTGNAFIIICAVLSVAFMAFTFAETKKREKSK